MFVIYASMCKHDNDNDDDDDDYDEYDVVRCIMMFDDWNSLFGKFWESSGLAVMLSNFHKNHGVRIILASYALIKKRWN